jgi:hypothetical protein
MVFKEILKFIPRKLHEKKIADHKAMFKEILKFIPRNVHKKKIAKANHKAMFKEILKEIPRNAHERKIANHKAVFNPILKELVQKHEALSPATSAPKTNHYVEFLESADLQTLQDQLNSTVTPQVIDSQNLVGPANDFAEILRSLGI